MYEKGVGKDTGMQCKGVLCLLTLERQRPRRGTSGCQSYQYSTRGVAISYKSYTSLILLPGVQIKECNWVSLIIKLQKGRRLNILTSYVRHGKDQEGVITVNEINKFLDQFSIPYVWVCDFTRDQQNLLKRA